MHALRRWSTLLALSGLVLAAATASAQAGPASAEVDILEMVSDKEKIPTPFGDIPLPAPGSWMLGPLDITPTKHVVFLWLGALVVLAVLLPAARAAGRRGGVGVPEGAHNAVEGLVLFIRDRVVMPNVGPAGGKYAPFLLTLFFFIVVLNLFGLVPFGASATSNISVTAALALIAFLVVEYAGVRARGWKGYFGTIFHRPAGMGRFSGWVMAVAMAPIELMGKVSKPFALAVRLMANMLAGKILIFAILSMVMTMGSYLLAPLPVAMVVAMTTLKVFVALLQAYIFVLLTSVFIGLSARTH